MTPSVQIEKITTLSGHKSSVYTLDKGSKAHIFYSAAGDSMIVEWDLKKPKDGRLIAKFMHPIYAICFIAQTNQIIVGENFFGLHVIDVRTRKEVTSFCLGNVLIFDIKYDNGFLYVGLNTGKLVIIDFLLFKIKKQLHLADKSVRAIHIAEDNIAIGLSDNSVRVIDKLRMKEVYRMNDHTNSVFTVTYSADNRWLLTAGRDAYVRIWDPLDRYRGSNFIVAHMHSINHIAYSPDGTYFATCSMDKSIKLWDATSFCLLKVIDKVRYSGHGTSVNKLLWSNHNNQLVSCSDDRTISVWNIEFK